MNFPTIFEQTQYDKQVDLTNYNRVISIVRVLAGLTFSKDFEVTQSGAGITVSLADIAAGLDFSKVALGFSLDGAIVKLKKGYVFHGTRDPIEIPAKEITITKDPNPTYLYVHYVLGGTTATWESSIDVPRHVEAEYNCLMYEASVIGETAKIDVYHHFGSIQVPGAFA
jgi:hypothetical protein